MRQPVSQTQKTLNLWAVVLIIWAIYRANFHLPEWFDELIAKPLVFILPVYFFIIKTEKHKFITAVSLKSKNFFKDILLGLGIGVIFSASAILANYIKFHKFAFSSKNISLESIITICILALATGISEEILSRGFVLKRLYEESHNVISSSFFASILFFFLHVPILFTNSRMMGNTLIIFMVTDLLLSLINSFVFLERKSLVLPILIHAFYNIAMILFY
jgi:membrane protease YdiL (CAAX protease family)